MATQPRSAQPLRIPRRTYSRRVNDPLSLHHKVCDYVGCKPPRPHVGGQFMGHALTDNSVATPLHQFCRDLHALALRDGRKLAESAPPIAGAQPEKNDRQKRQQGQDVQAPSPRIRFLFALRSRSPASSGTIGACAFQAGEPPQPLRLQLAMCRPDHILHCTRPSSGVRVFSKVPKFSGILGRPWTPRVRRVACVQEKLDVAFTTSDG